MDITLQTTRDFCNQVLNRDTRADADPPVGGGYPLALPSLSPSRGTQRGTEYRWQQKLVSKGDPFVSCRGSRVANSSVKERQLTR